MTLTRSRPNLGRGYLGSYPKELWAVLAITWEAGLSIQSNMAREMAPHVALAASLGWISTVSPDGKTHLRVWNVTREGITAYEHRDTYPKGRSHRKTAR